MFHPFDEIPTTIKNSELIIKRRQEIANAALKIFSQKGYYNTTIRDIAKEVNLGIGGIYAYISTKEDILRIIFDNYLHKLLEELEAVDSSLSHTDNLINKCRKFFSMNEKNAETIRLMYSELRFVQKDLIYYLFDYSNRIIQVFEKIIILGQQNGEFNRNIDPRTVAFDIMTFGNMWCFYKSFFKGKSWEEYSNSHINNILILLGANRS
ncbi:MAG: TetR/AcrR family transcriptional regulator [Syntrophomonadaceae bacterium]|jgi:AcrR family transcriptional regulator